ncbi:MAG: N-acetyltransferase [Comamonadaceae bacterium]|nr:MAG: N-acetyltransferase [Comamonadaceae bacterium]
MNARTDTLTPVPQSAEPVRAAESYLMAHYPTSLIDVRVLRDGRRLTLRPVLPQDNRLLAELINRLSDVSRSQRFPNAQQPASADELASLSCIDYRRHLALVVGIQENGRERLVAEARYRIDEDGHSAEFALVVDDEWQRCGIATWAMFALSRAAGAAGVSWLHCDMHADNEPMLALMRRCRFCCTVDRSDGAIVHAETRPRALNARRLNRPASPLAWLQRWLGTGPAAITQY